MKRHWRWKPESKLPVLNVVIFVFLVNPPRWPLMPFIPHWLQKWSQACFQIQDSCLPLSLLAISIPVLMAAHLHLPWLQPEGGERRCRKATWSLPSEQTCYHLPQKRWVTDRSMQPLPTSQRIHSRYKNAGISWDGWESLCGKQLFTGRRLWSYSNAE